MDQNVIDDNEPAQEVVNNIAIMEIYPPGDDETYYLMDNEILNDGSDSEFLFQNIICEEEYVDEEEDNENDVNVETSRENEVKITENNVPEDEEETVASMEISKEEMIDDDFNDEKHENEIKTTTAKTGKQFVKRQVICVKQSVEQTQWKCILCLDTFPSERILQMHHWLHWSCTKCKEPFFDTNLLLEHFVKCPKPEMKFVKLTQTKSFETNLGSKSFICDKCGKTFTKRHVFVSHLDMHNSFPRHRCGICDIHFYSSGVAKQHMLIHMKPQFECKICNRKFKRTSHLATHKRIAHEPNVTCSICGRFVKSSLITEHQKSNCKISSRLRKTKNCPLCDKAVSCLYDHLKTIHKRHDYRTKPLCRYCGKKFENYTAVSKHYSTCEKKHLILRCENCSQLCLTERGIQLHKLKCNGLSSYQKRKPKIKDNINEDEEITDAVQHII